MAGGAPAIGIFERARAPSSLIVALRSFVTVGIRSVVGVGRVLFRGFAGAAGVLLLAEGGGVGGMLGEEPRAG
jgi:hypothetical protein